MYKAILWDNDGVLVDTERWYYEATKRVMKEEGYNLTLDIYRKTFLKNNTGAWHLLKNCNKEYINILRKRRNSIYSSFLHTQDIYIQGLSEILGKLTKRYKMGIVTSSRKEHFDIIHKRSNILKYFDFVITFKENELLPSKKTERWFSPFTSFNITIDFTLYFILHIFIIQTYRTKFIIK